MFVVIFVPIAAFPLVGMIIQATSQFVPHADLWEKYGPLGVLAGWLMLQSLRDERRRDKQDRERDKRDKEWTEAFTAMVGELKAMKGRPCLLEVDDIEQLKPPRGKAKHGD